MSPQPVIQQSQPRSGASPGALPVDVRARAWYSSTPENVNFLVAGLIAIILQFVTTFQAIIVIVRKRELGTMDHLVVTPIARLELMLGKVIPLVDLGYVQDQAAARYSRTQRDVLNKMRDLWKVA